MTTVWYGSEFDHNLGIEKCPWVLLTDNLLQNIRKQMTVQQIALSNLNLAHVTYFVL